MKKPLKIDDDFTPCRVDAGDQLYPNGIFVFNITKMIEYIQRNPESFAVEEVSVSDFSQAFSSINESHVESVDISRPVILAEICPGRYNLIDGHHRVEKARRMGINSIRAYKLSAHRQMRFLIDEKGYVAYVEYWNGKLKGPGKIGRSNNKKDRRAKHSA
ncbi:ParB/RepB/Spo0J family partition protein [Desulfoferrobacter suflitae]|uniref:ParB/RepB/Spo0J family partition protein n=1 Tax=Desulfoferrobacter suflitae TaxID=2865782 RepID=UPI002164AEA0|nr:ParB/RepB/Spo0J family partition protein [Desulfoferrobacter suflitae]MCK8603952.1 ParB/RepB/Spo0J family partition protein [Desulfoferrobacter suflitae]